MLKKTEKDIHSPSPQDGRKLRWLPLLIVMVVCSGFVLTMLLNSRVSALPAHARAEIPNEGINPTDPQEGRDFSKFTHTNPTHAQLPCLLCHRRENGSSRPSLPGGQGHLPCAGCHTQQFADHSSPICTICHTNVEEGTLKPFPPLQSFGMKFNHQLHITGAARTPRGCVTCHKPDRGGVALSIPAGFNAHSTCFQCHAPQARSSTGRDISSCGVCHQLGSHARVNEWASAYRVSFSHAKHTAKGLSCNECHNVRAGLVQSKQVSTPVPLNHHAPQGAFSCMTCHNGKRAFGGDDFSSCKRCHQGAHFYF